MNEQQNPQLETAQQEAQKLSEVLQVRRDKLDALQAAGRDPFAITSYQRTATAAQIVAQFEQMEGQRVSIAGRMMSRRIMGKASFIDLQDGSGRVKNVDYQERYAWLDEADAVISATASPHYTITAGRAKEVMKTEKERLFVDVSVPPDIDAKIGRMKGCRLLAIDDFSRLAAHNNEEKRQAVADAAQILEEEVEELFKALALHNAANRIPEWKKKYEGMPFEKLVYLLRDELNSEAFEALLRALG